jgi:hypothetical protein
MVSRGVTQNTVKGSHPRQLQLNGGIRVLHKELSKSLTDAMAFSGDLVSLVIGNIEFVSYIFSVWLRCVCNYHGAHLRTVSALLFAFRSLGV